MRPLIYIYFSLVIFSSCSSHLPENNELPYLGRFKIVKTDIGVDTVFHRIADFKFLDQDSNWISNETFADNIYIADFFFTTCPDICPKMKAQMLRAYDSLSQTPEIKFLSHTIDPKHDSVAVLKEFATRIGAETERWHFVTGDKEEIYSLGQTSYLASMADDGAAGLTHSGKFFIIDKNRHIRGAYDGTNPENVNEMIVDVRKLLKSYDIQLQEEAAVSKE